ncbi:hypothetical protein [Paraflavitalea speifideaquila]|uniref:hypothetical protein n=1 Tax=Paraflavitalea speifideaquila TaxID=3076558 RepID=UPI0028E898FC|nr:hypothetical protein [Paraflavitalea speifideiaquila]
MKTINLFVASLFLLAFLGQDPIAEASHSDISQAKNSVEEAHRQIWLRFIDQYSILIDYADFSGNYPRPTAEEYKTNKPNALAWWTPTENGSMFNGLYMDGMCRRWLSTRNDNDKEKAKTLAKGLLFLASIGDTPGFIGRSVATDGRTPPAMGSNDQSSPWFYGLWRYLETGIPDQKERRKIISKMVEVANVYLTTNWKIPATSYSPAKFRNSFASFDWEGAPRILFISKALYSLTKDEKWNTIYLNAARERSGSENKSRLDICGAGMHFEKIKLIAGLAFQGLLICWHCMRWKRIPRSEKYTKKDSMQAPKVLLSQFRSGSNSTIMILRSFSVIGVY